jgi:hypothetical protein
MKNKSKIFLATILFLGIAASPLWAQTNVENVTSNVISTSTSPTTNNVQPSMDVDNSGIHVGGPASVDVKTPWTPPRFDFGILVPLAPFIMPVAILVVIFHFRYRRNKMMHETLRVMIEKGVPVTPELIASLTTKEKGRHETENSQTRYYLLPGLILTGIGIGVVSLAGKPGLIVLFIGVAFLIVWSVEKKNKGNEPPSKQ